MLIKVYINILEVYNERRSGWSLKQINHLEISSAVYDPILGEISRFEAQNYLSITVLGYDEDEEHFYHIYTSSVKNTRLEVELLPLKRHDDSHYVLIRNLSRLLAHSKCKVINTTSVDIVCRDLQPSQFWKIHKAKSLEIVHSCASQTLTPSSMILCRYFL